jgi:adenylylsulfate kinase-like enzyme
MNKVYECFFIVGLSASGKTTLATRLVDHLRETGFQSILVDGDQINEYSILNKYNGHDLESRLQRGKDLTNFVQWLINCNVIPVISVIGQPAKLRTYWKKHIKSYTEIQLNCDVITCQKRDKKNLYNRALNEDIKNVIGIDIPYEDPLTSNLTIDTINLTKEAVFKEVLEYFYL